ncbi:MAG: hypothetical protein SGPRY_008575, partial [Prymnesium sp.]
MFSARRKASKDKEVPAWKLALQASEPEMSRPPALTPAAVDDPSASARSGEGRVNSAPSSPNASKRVLSAPPLEVDDDDDDDADLSKYKLDDDDDGDAPSGPLPWLGEPTQETSVSVCNIAHRTTGEHLKAFFDRCGPVLRVLRSVDVRDRSGFVIFATRGSAERAVLRSGEELHEAKLLISLGPDVKSLPGTHVPAREKQALATYGFDPTRRPGLAQPGTRERGTESTLPEYCDRARSVSEDFNPGGK